MSQAPCELAVSWGANKEPGNQQGAQIASNEPGSQRPGNEPAMRQGAY